MKMVFFDKEWIFWFELKFSQIWIYILIENDIFY